MLIIKAQISLKKLFFLDHKTTTKPCLSPQLQLLLPPPLSLSPRLLSLSLRLPSLSLPLPLSWLRKSIDCLPSPESSSFALTLMGRNVLPVSAQAKSATRPSGLVGEGFRALFFSRQGCRSSVRSRPTGCMGCHIHSPRRRLWLLALLAPASRLALLAKSGLSERLRRSRSARARPSFGYIRADSARLRCFWPQVFPCQMSMTWRAGAARKSTHWLASCPSAGCTSRCIPKLVVVGATLPTQRLGLSRSTARAERPRLSWPGLLLMLFSPDSDYCCNQHQTGFF